MSAVGLSPERGIWRFPSEQVGRKAKPSELDHINFRNHLPGQIIFFLEHTAICASSYYIIEEENSDILHHRKPMLAAQALKLVYTDGSSKPNYP
jgi:hypothetical protein